jgi:hypothetical protein
MEPDQAWGPQITESMRHETAGRKESTDKFHGFAYPSFSPPINSCVLRADALERAIVILAMRQWIRAQDIDVMYFDDIVADLF